MGGGPKVIGVHSKFRWGKCTKISGTCASSLTDEELPTAGVVRPDGRLHPDLVELPPRERRMSANPHANGGMLPRDLRLPDFRDYPVDVTSPGAAHAESTRHMGAFLRDILKLNTDYRNFRLFSPDENNSNHWQDALEVTNHVWIAERYPFDDHLAPEGRGCGNAQRAPVPRLARRLPADWPARLFLVLRGVHRISVTRWQSRCGMGRSANRCARPEHKG